MRTFVVGNYMNAIFLRLPHLPRLGQSIEATSVFREHGGKGLNLAIGLHKLGINVDLIMAIGDDDSGASVTRVLRTIGLDTKRVVVVDEPSGLGVGFIAADGSNFLSAHLGANLRLSTAHIEDSRDAICRAEWTLGQFESPDAVNLAAFRIAKAAHRRVYLNPSPWREPESDMFDLCDVLTLNESEAAAFFGLPAQEKASLDEWRSLLSTHGRARQWKGDWLIVTLAARGAIARRGDGRIIYEPPFAIAQHDATGAGDAFGAGFLYGLGLGDENDALRIGNACGAMVARREGILQWLPQQAELNEFLRSASATQVSFSL